MSLGRYVLLILAVAACVFALAWPLGLGDLDTAGRQASLYGGSLAVLNAIASHSLLRWSDRRPTRAFLRAILWGTAGRLGALLLAVAVGILLVELPALPLTSSLLLLFVVFLFIELAQVHRHPPVLSGTGR